MLLDILSLVADVILVIITGTYAYFTVQIFNANSEANKLVREQIEDSNKQYEESKQLEIMPYFKVTLEELNGDRTSINTPYPDIKIGYNITDRYWTDVNTVKITLENVGLGTATNIWYYGTTYMDFSCIQDEGPNTNPVAVGDKTYLLLSLGHQSYDGLVNENITHINVYLRIQYEDLIKTKYVMNIGLLFLLTSPQQSMTYHGFNIYERRKLENTPEQNS